MISWIRYCLWYRITHPRCLIRHKWGADIREHELGLLYEAYVECQRCDAYLLTYNVPRGQTLGGKKINRPYGSST